MHPSLPLSPCQPPAPPPLTHVHFSQVRMCSYGLRSTPQWSCIASILVQPCVLHCDLYRIHPKYICHSATPASIHTYSQDIDTPGFRGTPCSYYFICQPQAFPCTPAPLPAHVSHLLLLPCTPNYPQPGHIASLSLVSQSTDHFQASQIFLKPFTAQQCPKSPWSASGGPSISSTCGWPTVESLI